MNKKTEGKATAPGAAQDAQQRMHEVYLAHQVHTLVQVIFQQLASNWAMSPPWPPPAGEPFAPPQPMAMGCRPPVGPPGMPGAGPMGFAPPPGSPVVYWYP